MLVGISKELRKQQWIDVANEEIHELRKCLDEFIRVYPEFLSSYVPLSYAFDVPEPISELLEAGKIARTGPMAGIAGLFSTYAGRSITGTTYLDEVIVENGGDIYARISEDLQVALYAGSSPLSNQLAVRIPYGEWGICTSSGTVGHSKSFGHADALTIISKSPVIADALATALANEVSTEADIDKVLEMSEAYKDIEGIVIIIGDKIGIRGKFELIPIS